MTPRLPQACEADQWQNRHVGSGRCNTDGMINRPTTDHAGQRILNGTHESLCSNDSFYVPKGNFSTIAPRFPELAVRTCRSMRTYEQRKRHNEVATGLSFVVVALMVLSFMGLAQHFGLSLA